MHCKTLKKIILFISIILLVLTTFSIYVRADDSSSLYLDKQICFAFVLSKVKYFNILAKKINRKRITDFERGKLREL